MARWSKKSSAKAAAKKVAAAGRTGSDGVKDTELIHVNKAEMPIVDRALKRYGGAGSRNPKTGLREYKYGADTNEGGAHGFKGGSGKTTAGGDKPAPIKPTGPTGPDQSFGSPESAAAANLGPSDSLGGTPAAQPGNLPTGVTPMSKPKPMGATPYVEGASTGAILDKVLGGPLGPVGTAITLGKIGYQGITGKPPPSLFGGDEGKQTGWSEDPGMTPGRDRSQRGTKTAAKSGGASGAGSGASSGDAGGGTSTSTGASAAGAAGTDGRTITVNPDGTIRTQDTSVAGLRAQRRYGAKTQPKTT